MWIIQLNRNTSISSTSMMCHMSVMLPDLGIGTMVHFLRHRNDAVNERVFDISVVKPWSLSVEVKQGR